MHPNVTALLTGGRSEAETEEEAEEDEEEEGRRGRRWRHQRMKKKMNIANQ